MALLRQSMSEEEARPMADAVSSDNELNLAVLLAQQKRFEALESATSESLAYFYCCIAFDVPFDLNAVPGNKPKQKWVEYRDNLRMKGLDRTKGGALYGFLDGLTDITKIFGASLDAGEFSKAVSNERSARDTKAGTNKQREIWGSAQSGRHYSAQDYKRLDELFAIYSKRVMASGGMDAQQEYILRQCSRMSLEQEKCLAGGLYDKAQKLNKMIQENLASENLRKRDEKPVDDVRIDAIVDRLEKAGLLRNGKFCDPDEMFQTIFGRPPKYAYTRDAAEQMLLAIINCSATNDSLPELPTLPDHLRIHDDLGEFAEKPNDQENEAYEKLGLLPMPTAKKQGGKDIAGE